MSDGPYRSEHWVFMAPDITGEEDTPAAVVHFDEEGYLALVQCPRVLWGMEINEILETINARDSMHDQAPDISSNFFAQTNNLIQRNDRDYPRLIKQKLRSDHNITVLKHQHTEEGTRAHELLEDFGESAHKRDQD